MEVKEPGVWSTVITGVTGVSGVGTRRAGELVLSASWAGHGESAAPLGIYL